MTTTSILFHMLVLRANILLACLAVGTGFRHNQKTAGVPPKDNFRGGHAENQLIDKDACEFKKSHDSSEMGRFKNEVKFLSAVNASALWRPIVPQLKRVEEHDGRPFMVLEKVDCDLEHPVIADFKLGTQSWAPDFNGKSNADEKKRAKMDILDIKTTTKILGVRATSVQLPPSLEEWNEEGIHENAKYLLAGRTAEKKGLLESTQSKWRAGSSPSDFEKIVQAYLPTSILREQFLERLQSFIEVFKVQDTYRFTGASLFVMYDGKHARTEPKLRMVLIDFPHTLGDAEHKFGEIDEGVLKGLHTLDKIVREA